MSDIEGKGNLKAWAKEATKHSVGTEGAIADFKAGDVKDWKQPQRKSEGRGWAPMDKVTQANTFTGQSKK